VIAPLGLLQNAFVLHCSSGLIRFIASHCTIFAPAASVIPMNFTFCSAGYSLILKLVIFLDQKLLINMNKVIGQYCHRAMGLSCERLCQFIPDLIRCRD